MKTTNRVRCNSTAAKVPTQTKNHPEKAAAKVFLQPTTGTRKIKVWLPQPVLKSLDAAVVKLGRSREEII